MIRNHANGGIQNSGFSESSYNEGIPEPPKGIVDGIYRNTCCADIVIREPKISHGNDTFDIKISDMKFGLTGIVVGQFIADGIQKSDKDTWLSFSKEGENRVINLPIGNNEYSFRRIEGSTLSK